MPRGRTVALVLLVATLGACTSGGRDSASTPAPPGPADRVTLSRPQPTPPTSTPARTHHPPPHPSSSPPVRPHRSDHRHPTGTSTTAPPSTAPARSTSPHTRPPGAALPLDYPTGDATQVLTVVAGAESDTSGTLQAWHRVPGGWQRAGPALPAWLGSAGMTPQPSETISATPMGSWTLTRAFGRDADPGTRLPYTRTTPADWWISQPGPLYNTLQRCLAACAFTQGDPNEHLYYVAPEYDYAVVIDYNTDNSGPVRQGAGSAFFLHVSAGEPTAGCVAIGMSALVRIMRWLNPADHPRVLIGTG